MDPSHPADPVPPPPSPFLAWAFRLAKLAALAAGVYVCFFLLAGISLTGDRLERIRITSVHVEGKELRVRGQAWPGDMIELLAGERSLGATFPDWRGRFEVWADAPPDAQGIWARVLSEGHPDLEVARSDVFPLPRRPGMPPGPRIALAYFVEEPRVLWVAGRGHPKETFLLRSAAGEPVGSVEIDANGCFDLLVPIPPDREPPGALVLAGRATDGKAFDVTWTSAANLPLSRTIRIENRRETRLILTARVPATHPYFELLEKGLISTDEFRKAVFGAGFLPEKLELTSLRKTPTEGVVELEQTWTFPSPMLFWVGTTGIGEYPLLTGRDRFEVRFEVAPAWFGDPPPAFLEKDAAIWQGPLRKDQEIELGFRIDDLARSYEGFTVEGQAGPGKEERFRDFIGRISGQGGAVLQTAWREKTVLLIPFAGLLWLAVRRPFGSPVFWRALAATALVLAGWRVLVAVAPYLEGIGYLLLSLFDYDSERDAQAGNLLSQAFWIPFALFAAALPSCWQRLADSEPLSGPSGRRWSRLRLVAFGAWSAYILAACLLFLAVASGIFRLEDVLEPGPWLWAMSLRVCLCLCLVLLGFGLRAFLVGAAVLLVVLRHLAGNGIVSGLDLLTRLPAGLLLLIVVLAAAPFVVLLVRKLTGSFLGWRGASLLSAALIAGALLAPHLPVRGALALEGALLLYGFGGVLLRLLLTFDAAKPWAHAVRSWPRAARCALLFLALLLAWPMTGPATKLDPGQLRSLNLQVENLFVYVLGLGLILLLREQARASKSPVVERAVLGTGVYLFAVVLINSYSPWLLLPVPFLVGLLIAGSWLFRPEGEMQRLRAIPLEKLARARRLIQDVVDASTAGEQFAAIRKSLNQKLNSAELTPQEYEDKLDVYRTHLEDKLELENVARGVTSREAVFAVGGPDLWSNVSAAVRTGAVLASGPFLIALYQFLPYSRVSYPYPLVTLLVFILSAAASWLLYSFFFGFYYASLRGRSGLSKGIHLFFALGLPFAVYRLLNAQSLTDMRSFLLWATQLFLFCSLLGLIAFDHRLLRSHGFRVRDLTAVHDVPALSAYASTALAALVPTVTALITGKFGELVKFFLETVLGMPSG
ncbi:MAG: hypothetical protein ABUT39_02155 [Acidobacteriota bacterium]